MRSTLTTSEQGKKPPTAAPINEMTLIGNKLKYLPTFVGTLSCLQRLHVDDGLIDPPKHIMDEGIPIIQMVRPMKIWMSSFCLR